ncbi:MAG: HDOD domain-containing protein [bacterium]|nr:HDOD domain-containing protein [bacterium]
MVRLRRSRAKDRGADLRKVLGSAELPAIPELVTTAIEQVSAPDCDLREVAKTVGLDPGISARLLTVVNSAAYAPRNPIVGVSQAVTMFGKNRLESMLIALAVSHAVAVEPVPGFDMTRFWRTSAWRASAATTLSRRVDRARSSMNFSAALLENIAVPLLITHVPGYRPIHDAWRGGDGELEDLESRAFGWTHFEVAGWLFEEWDFPPTLRDAVTEAGQPTDAHVEYPVVRVVSSLSAPRAETEVIEETAARMTATFGLDLEEGLELLASAKTDGAKLAQYL